MSTPATTPLADPTALSPASFARRAAAQVVYFLICAAVLYAIVGGIVIYMTYFADPATANMPKVPADEQRKALLFVSLTLSTIGLLYYPLFEASRFQATPGKRLLDLMVTTESGVRINLEMAYGRTIAKLASLAILGIGYLMPLFTARRQALHDLWSGCLVIRRGRRHDA